MFVAVAFLKKWKPGALFGEYRTVWRVRELRLLALSRLCASMIFYSTVMVIFQRERGLDFTQMFLLESILSLAALLFDVPTSVLADRIGYRWLLLLGRSLELIGMLIWIVSYGFWPFAFCSLLSGGSIACVSGCEDALIASSVSVAQMGEKAQGDTTPTSGAAFALLGAASSAGFFVGLAIGSFFGAHDATLPFIVTLLPMALAVAFTASLGKPKPAEVRFEQAEQMEQREVERPGVGELLRNAWRLARRSPALVALGLAQSGAFALVNAIFWYNQPFFGHAGIAVFWFGPLTALAVGCAALVPLALPAVTLRIGRRGAQAVALLTPGMAYIGLALALGMRSAPLVVALVALLVSGAAWRDPLISDELTRRVGVRGRATALSTLSLLGAVAGIALNPLIGHVGDVGLGAVGFTLGGGLLALGFCAPWL